MKKSAGNGSTDFRLVEQLCFRLLPAQVLLLASVGAVNSLITSLFASNYVGAQAMSAIGLYSPIDSFLGAVGVMLMGGSQILCGKYMGKDQLSETQKIFSLDLAMAALFALCMTALMLAAGTFDLTGLFAEDPQIRRYFNLYLLGKAVGILPQLLAQQLAAFLSLENRKRRTAAASGAYFCANLAMNVIFVRCLNWGAFGVALASSLGLWVLFGVQGLYYAGGRSRLKLRLKELCWGEARNIMVTGIPSALSNGYLTIRGLLMNALILHYVGGIGLSAFTASNAFLNFFWAIPGGMLAVSRMLISISVGEEDRKTLQDVMRVALRRFIPLMAGIALVIAVLAEPLARLYFSDTSGQVFMMTVWGFRVLPFCMPLTLICTHFVCYGQASNKQGLIHILSVLDGFICVVGFTALLMPHIGIMGAYAANVLNGIVVAMCVLIYAWIKNRHFPRSLEELMVIPESFGAAEDCRMDITLRGMQEVVTVSRRVEGFCLEKGIDRRRACFAALAVEEMAGNVVEHGFTKDRRPHTAELRVVCKGDKLILRIRDDCRPFDPSQRLEPAESRDPAKNVGIRLVYSLAQEVSYRNILGLNALTVTLEPQAGDGTTK